MDHFRKVFGDSSDPVRLQCGHSKILHFSTRPPPIFTFLLYRRILRISRFVNENLIKNAQKLGPLQGPPPRPVFESILAPF